MSRVGMITAISMSLLGVASVVHAEPAKFDALVAQKEAIRLDFADASKRFFLLVRREGKTEGQGPFAGANVREYGVHDVVPGVGGDRSSQEVLSQKPATVGKLRLAPTAERS